MTAWCVERNALYNGQRGNRGMKLGPMRSDSNIENTPSTLLWARELFGAATGTRDKGGARETSGRRADEESASLACRLQQRMLFVLMSAVNFVAPSKSQIIDMHSKIVLQGTSDGYSEKKTGSSALNARSATHKKSVL